LTHDRLRLRDGRRDNPGRHGAQYRLFDWLRQEVDRNVQDAQGVAETTQGRTSARGGPAPGRRYTPRVGSDLVPRPLVQWDGFTVRVDLDVLELTINRELSRKVPHVDELRVAGDGDRLQLDVRLSWQGLPARVSARVADVRLYRRFVGCRVEALRGPLGVPIPLELASAAVRRFAPSIVRFDADDRILLVDLRNRLPDGLRLEVGAVRVVGRTLEVELAPGSLSGLSRM